MKGGLRRPPLAQQYPRAAIPSTWNRATPGNPCLPAKVRASVMPVLRKAQSALSSVERTVLSERRQPRWHRQWPVRIRFLTYSERQLSNLWEGARTSGSLELIKSENDVNRGVHLHGFAIAAEKTSDSSG